MGNIITIPTIQQDKTIIYSTCSITLLGTILPKNKIIYYIAMSPFIV